MFRSPSRAQSSDEPQHTVEGDASGRDASGPDASGPDASGRDASGPDASGPDASGSRARSDDAAGKTMIEQHIEGLDDVRSSLPGRASTGDLVERVVAGDTAALGQLYDHHHATLRAFAIRLLGDATAAEDLVHDVFIALPAALRRFEGRCTLRTFILSVAANHARHRARSLARRARTLDRFRSFGGQRRPAAPDEEGERRQLASLLESAIRQLPIEQRMVIVLCAVEERTSVETAAILGVPEGTVRTRLFHARKKLREYLQMNGLRAHEAGQGRSEP